MIPAGVNVAAEVRALFAGLDLERAVAEATRQGFTCPACRRPGTVTGASPVSVSVIRHPDGLRVLFAHADCAPSLVLASPTPRFGPELDETDVRTEALVVATSAGARALLCMEVSVPPLLVTPSGDSLDPAVELLLSAGWALLTGVDEEILTLPTLTGAWRVQVDPTGAGHVRSPRGMLLDRLPGTETWARTALTNRAVTMLVGPIGLPSSGASRHLEATTTAIATAIHRGSVAGAILPAQPPRPPSGRAQPPKRR